MKKFLFINPFGIGDCLFTTPLIRAVKDADPQNRVSFWCNERVKELFEANPGIDRVFALSRGDLKKVFQDSKLKGIKRSIGLWQGLKREKFDIAFDFSLDHRYGLVAKFLGIKVRVGYNYKKRGRFLTQKIALEGYSNRHIAEYYLDLLKFVGITPKSRDLELFVSELNNVKAESILRQAGVQDNDLLVGFAAGAGESWGKDAGLKHWPALKYAQLADKIIDNFGAKILLLGDASERSIADTIIAAMRNKPVDLVGKTLLGEFAAVINNLKLLVTNDGGPLHMAVALKVKTVSIFGPVSEVLYGPYPPSESHAVIKYDISCRPCYKNFKMPVCEANRECLKSITVEDVFNAVRRQM